MGDEAWWISVAAPRASRPNPETLLALALSRPGEALLAARALLDSGPGPWAASIAYQAVGIVLRDRGEVAAALAELGKGLRLARASGRTDREADVRATLGLTLALAGRTRAGLAQLDAAVRDARGATAGRILSRRAMVLIGLGRYQPALEDLNLALPHLRRGGDTVWLARTLSWRAQVHLALGSTARATADFVHAEELFDRNGQELERAMARHNRGMFAAAQGNLPLALTCLSEAAGQYEAVGATIPELAVDRSAVLLAAGLPRDALREADAALSTMHATRGQTSTRAELLYSAARAALAIPDLSVAMDRAQQARRLFRSQGRVLWRLRSELVLAQARFADGQSSTALANHTDELAVSLGPLDAEQALRAHLLAGRVALAIGHDAAAQHHLARAARTRRGAPPLVRSLGWLARALWAESAADHRATLSACRAGLAALDEHLVTLGSTELRAHGTAHGVELAAIAQRQAVLRGDARGLLIASERWRATAITTAPPRTAQSPTTAARADPTTLSQPLAALRAVVRQLESHRASGSPTTALERERRRLEATIRERTLQSTGSRPRRRPALDARALAGALGTTRLVELVEVDGALHALTVVGGRARRHRRAGLPARDVEHARFMLRRLAQGPPRWQTDQLLDELGRRLQEALLGPALADLGADDPVVVVPPGTLHAVPWALLPALRERVLSVAPSAAAYLQMRAVAQPPSRHVAFVVGPGLGSGAGEVAELATQYAGATVLGHGTATAEDVLAALDGAWLAHLAAHGTFRTDNPLFSALQLDDGPLTVHDFERLTRAPYRVLLPCCDSGVGAPVGADELLGLVSSLFPLGSAGVLASVVPINDRATVPLMVALHAALRAGSTLPEALLSARAATADDPVSVATGYSFIAFGI